MVSGLLKGHEVWMVSEVSKSSLVRSDNWGEELL